MTIQPPSGDFNVLQNSDSHMAKIKVIGVGGCGGNLVNYMSGRQTAGVSFVAVNTDSQALNAMREGVETVQIGIGSTGGLGAGGNPEVARAAAEAETDRLGELVAGFDMVFIVAGMGKGTGTGASPVIAEIAQKASVLAVSLAVMPFDHERRRKVAEEGLRMLAKSSDSLIVAPNERLLEAMGDDVTMNDAILAANDLLYNAVCGISDIINKPGVMNVDFNDVRAAMAGKGKAVIGSALADGEDRALRAAEQALQSELMENVDLAGASSVIVNISGWRVKMREMKDVVRVIEERVVDLRGSITHGMLDDETMGNDMRVTLVVTGVCEVRAASGGHIQNVGGEGGGGGPRGPFDSGRGEAGGDRRTPSVIRRQTN